MVSKDFLHCAIISSFIIPNAASIPVGTPDGGPGNNGCLIPDPGNPGKLEEPCNSANAFAKGLFCVCIIFALSRSNISNEDVDSPPVNEGERDRFPGLDDGRANCPGNTGEGEFERGAEGDGMGFNPAVLNVSAAPLGVLSNKTSRLSSS